MKTPIWESSPGALEALLETNQFVMADLYTYIAADGVTVLCRIATADVDITIGPFSSRLLADTGGIFLTDAGDFLNFDPASSTSPIIWPAKYPLHGAVGGSRPLGHWKTGLDVDSWQIRVSPRKADPVTAVPYPDTLLGKPWLQSIRVGNLDGTALRVDRAYFPSWSTNAATWGAKGLTPTGVLTIFAGPIVAADIDQGGAVLTINDYRVLLTVPYPSALFTLSCRHMLFDTACTLVQSSFSRSGTAIAGSTPAAVKSAVAAPPGSATYALGKLLMTSGANAGFTRFIRAWDGTTFTPIAPFPYAIAVGDTFTASAGCDKTKATCTLFGNAVNYGGEDFIPAPETAI